MRSSPRNPKTPKKPTRTVQYRLYTNRNSYIYRFASLAPGWFPSPVHFFYQYDIIAIRYIYDLPLALTASAHLGLCLMAAPEGVSFTPGVCLEDLVRGAVQASSGGLTPSTNNSRAV